MIKYYVNRELSSKLSVRLSKWKRWSREFLPPDPLGGMQSGYARQYTRDQAFSVFLGGHLVAGLNFSIPEARQVVQELSPWLNAYKANGVGKEAAGKFEDTQVHIFKHRSSASGRAPFFYVERNRLSDEPCELDGRQARREVYMENPIHVAASGTGMDEPDCFDRLNSRILYISRLYALFMERLV